MRFSRATVIANPASRARKALRVAGGILHEIKGCAGKVHFIQTGAQHDGIRLATQAVETGSELVVAIGGDGTANEVVNGLVEGSKRVGRDCLFGIIPAGTTCSLARELGIPRGLAAVNVFAEGSVRAIDLALLRWLTPYGEWRERLAATVCHFGFGGAVARVVGPAVKWLGGALAFGSVAMLKLLRYSGSRMTVHVDGRKTAQGRLFCAIVANTRWEGGGMCVAPQARPDDGLLDLILVENLPPLSRLRHFPKVYRGTHVTLPAVTCATGKNVAVTSTGILPFEFDGESAECRECSIELLPKALNVLVPKAFAPPGT